MRFKAVNCLFGNDVLGSVEDHSFTRRRRKLCDRLALASYVSGTYWVVVQSMNEAAAATRNSNLDL